jgi:hypothetical protein
MGGMNRPGPEAIAKVGNELSYTSALSVCFMVYRLTALYIKDFSCLDHEVDI